ncbi:MAG: hypothetical protein JWN08_30, partial [Frankiales bacterium]|nr:hypothetical protein [Frankiales bacterium]
MIVISGALVLVALVLLVIGIVGPELGFVYASIAVSLVSLVFLVIGILQRRGETLPAAPAGAPAPTAHVEDPAQDLTAVQPSGTRPTTPEPAPLAASAADELETGGTVLVVAGRPRYHVAGCRYLSGKDAEAIDVLDALEEGFTPCGVCRPDDALLALQAEEGAPAAELEAPAPLELEEVEASTPTRVAKAPVASRRSTPSKPPSKAPARTPAKAAARAPRAVPEPLVAAPVVEPAVVEPAVVESSLPEPAVPVQAPVAPVAPVAEPAPARRAAKV